MNNFDHLIDIEYRFDIANDKILSGSYLEGKLIVRPKENIGFDFVTCNLRNVVTGKLSLGKKKLDSISLGTHGKWTKGRIYEFDIGFRIPENAFSFKGKHLEIIWLITLVVDPNKDTMSFIRKSFLKDVKLAKLFKTFRGEVTSDFLLDISPLNKYKINHQSLTFDSPGQKYAIIGFSILAIVWICYTLGWFGIVSYFAILSTLGLFGFSIYTKASIGKLGKVSLEVSPNDFDTFNLKIKVEKNMKRVSQMYVYYSINEEVVDNRGSDTTTYKNRMYTSSKLPYNNMTSNNIDVSLPYPKYLYPGNYKLKTGKIFWQIHLDFEFSNGTTYQIEKPFVIRNHSS